jgi:hypothetical protein
LGSTLGVWDWRIPNYQIVYFPSNSNNPTTRTIDSPFFTTGVNINHLAFGGNGPKDFEPAEGWELLYRNLGVAEKPVEEPSFGLYNRLDGRIRIFFYIEPNNEDTPDNVMIRLSQYPLEGRFDATGLFENLNIPANALSNFDKNISLSGMSQLNEGSSGSQWYLLEGVASYDPCICQNESALEVQPILTSITSLGFELDGGGSSQAVYGPGNPIPTLGLFNGVADKFTSGYKKYKSAAAYFEDVKKNDGKSVGVLSSLLGGFNGVLGPVSGVTELLGFVLGKKSVATPPKLTGFNHNFSFTANGELENNSNYDPYFFYTPGSFYRENQLEAFRPVYDNPLGVMTLLEPPVIERAESGENGVFYGDVDGENYTVETFRWRFAGNLRYHINTLAGISSRPVQLMASLVWPNTCTGAEDFFATPAINITCLEDYVVEFENIFGQEIDIRTGDLYSFNELNGCAGPPELQIVAVLTSTGPTPGQEILYTARYLTTVRDLPAGSIGENPFEGMTLEEINASCSTEVPSPVSDLKLSRFCEKSYNPKFGKVISDNGIVGEDSESLNAEVPGSTTVFPNPFVDQLSIRLKAEWLNTSLNFQLHDALGKVVWSKEGLIPTTETLTLNNDLTGLPSGTYLLTITNAKSAETIILQKK